ncbi:MAG: hypothetical protein KatS3mg052_1393 [Candidatus Roseilinea sp.]|nr:MAG: hypothetical protein KatS3mg052_1393 [Candidatus Roseilinea sp.]
MRGFLHQRSPAPELLDERAYRDLEELRGNLRDMARYDRRLGVFARATRLVTAALPPTATGYTGLDVGCGSCDFIAYARQVMPAARWVGVDVSSDVLRLARQERPEVFAICAWGMRLPLADASVDVVTCIHVLHHLNPPEAIALLRELRRVARRQVVCLDLSRNVSALVGAWLLTRLTSRNRLTRADGVRSVRRAYTAAEAADLARQAGWAHFRTRLHGPFHYSLTLMQSLA